RGIRTGKVHGLIGYVLDALAAALGLIVDLDRGPDLLDLRNPALVQGVWERRPGPLKPDLLRHRSTAHEQPGRRCNYRAHEGLLAATGRAPKGDHTIRCASLVARTASAGPPAGAKIRIRRAPPEQDR